MPTSPTGEGGESKRTKTAIQGMREGLDNVFNKTGAPIEVNVCNTSNNRCIGDPVNHTEQTNCMRKYSKIVILTQLRKDG